MSAVAIAYETCPTCRRLGYDSDCGMCAGEGRIHLRAVEPPPTRALNADTIEACAFGIADTLISAVHPSARYDAAIVASMLAESIAEGRAVMVRRAEQRLPGLGERVVRSFVAALSERASTLEYAHRLGMAPSEARRLRALARELGDET